MNNLHSLHKPPCNNIFTFHERTLTNEKKRGKKAKVTRTYDATARMQGKSTLVDFLMGNFNSVPMAYPDNMKNTAWKPC